MPQAVVYPGVYVEEVPSQVRTIAGVPTSIALFVGWARKGPVDRAVRLTRYADYERTYGALEADSLLGHAVRHFYDNGGSDAYAVRLVDSKGVEGPPAVSAAAAAQATIAQVDPALDLVVKARSPGTWGNALSVKVTPAPDGAATLVLEVFDGSGDLLESFDNLSFETNDPRYLPTVVIGSSSLIDVALAPTGGGSATAAPTRLSGGEDGAIPDPAATGVTDFHEDLLALFAPGGLADRLDLFNILCVPGLAEPATIAKLQGFARARRAFLVLDARENDTVSGLSAPPAALAGDDALNSALYFPWVLAPDPLEPGALRAYPPCGAIAGIFARTDAERGVWKAPAGTGARLDGILGLKVPVSDAENRQINRRGVNCLRTFPVYGPVVWGARTLHGDDDRGSEWKYIPVRRTALFIEESLYRGTQWAVFEPNDEPLWAQIRLTIGAFMNGLFRQGASQGQTPRDAYFVRCDRETTTQADIDNGIVNILVGFAPLKPAEFVVIKIQQIAGNMPT